MTQLEPLNEENRIAHDLLGLFHASGESSALDVPGTSEGELIEITALLNSLARLRTAESELAEASRGFLNASAQEMRALRYLVVAGRHDGPITPSRIAAHLNMSAASTTKLLNRLERGDHIVRELHPHDRRAIKVKVTPRTEALVQRAVGRQQARRFHAAASLSSAERSAVARFLDEITAKFESDRELWAAREGNEPEHLLGD